MSEMDKGKCGVRSAECGIVAAYSGCFFSPVSGVAGGTSADFDSPAFAASGEAESGGVAAGAAVAGGGNEGGGGTSALVPALSRKLDKFTCGRSARLLGQPGLALA